MIEEQESRRVRTQIREVLLTVWDPIGVRDEPNVQDEYDAYVSGVHDLLVTGADDAKIADHLWRIVVERMGLGATPEAILGTVRALRAISISGAS